MQRRVKSLFHCVLHSEWKTFQTQRSSTPPGETSSVGDGCIHVHSFFPGREGILQVWLGMVFFPRSQTCSNLNCRPQRISVRFLSWILSCFCFFAYWKNVETTNVHCFCLPRLSFPHLWRWFPFTWYFSICPYYLPNLPCFLFVAQASPLFISEKSHSAGLLRRIHHRTWRDLCPHIFLESSLFIGTVNEAVFSPGWTDSKQ